MVTLLDGDSPPSCITQNPDFASICLCRAALTVSLHSDVFTDDKRYIHNSVKWHTVYYICVGNFDAWAYRQLT